MNLNKLSRKHTLTSLAKTCGVSGEGQSSWTGRTSGKAAEEKMTRICSLDLKLATTPAFTASMTRWRWLRPPTLSHRRWMTRICSAKSLQPIQSAIFMQWAASL